MGDYDRAIAAALEGFWGTRESQAERQRLTGKHDAGTRGAVTGGQHLNAIGDLIISTAKSAVNVGITIHTGGGGTTIPGFYRPSKTWDIVLRRAGEILAVIELKSMVGSFGNNMNNRSEEALGNITDLLAARDHGLIEGNPFRGYAFIIEHNPKSDAMSTLGTRQGVVIDPEFHGASYIDRVAMLCERMVKDDLYSAAWAVATTAPPEFSWYEPRPETTGFDRFASLLTSHL